MSASAVEKKIWTPQDYYRIPEVRPWIRSENFNAKTRRHEGTKAQT